MTGRMDGVKRGAALAGATLAAMAMMTAMHLPAAQAAVSLGAPQVLAAGAATATPPDSVAILLASVKKDSTNVATRFRLANALYDAGRKEEALEQYTKVLARNPKHVEAMVNEGNLLNEMGKSDQAADLLAKALALRPNDALALASMGNVLYGEQKYAEASDMYRKALIADPKCYQAEYYWGVAFADAQIYKEAIAHWQKCADMAPTSSAAESARENIKVVQQFLSGK